MEDSSVLGRPNTHEALQTFPAGKMLVLKYHDRPEFQVNFTVIRVFTPVTKSVAVLASGNEGSVVIKIYDPRFLDERFSLTSDRADPWLLANERAAAEARRHNPISEADLDASLASDDVKPKDRRVFLEEKFYRLVMGCYQVELDAYQHLKDLQGSTIPRLIMAGQFLSPEKRFITIPALVLQYIQGDSLLYTPATAITPAIRDSLTAIIKAIHSRDVAHGDINLHNVIITPEQRVVLIDFGEAYIRQAGKPEDLGWDILVEDDVGNSGVLWKNMHDALSKFKKLYSPSS